MVYKSIPGTLFNICNYVFFIIFCISVLVPFINVLSISLSDYSSVMVGQISFLPRGFNVDSYRTLIANVTFVRSFFNTVFITVVNTVLVILISLSAAYALANKNLMGKKIFFTYIIITIYFSGGLIPTYLLVNSLGLNNTYWALILTGIVSPFYIIIFKNVIDQLPKELLESAEIDGSGSITTLIRIVAPLVLPMTMAFTIFSAVVYWNEWFGVLLYIRDRDLWTLQYQLRDILVNAKLSSNETNMSLLKGVGNIPSEGLKMAALMITVIPIIAVYPFVQKYFIHGQLVGAVKG